MGNGEPGKHNERNIKKTMDHAPYHAPYHAPWTMDGTAGWNWGLDGCID